MKQFRVALWLLSVAMLIFLHSCGGGDKQEEKEKGTTDTTANTNPAVVNTIVTTPQGMMVARHKVADFANWKKSYDAHDSMRLANGIHNYVIGRGLKDTNMVLVAVKVDDMAKAKAFAKDPSLKQAMQKGGVTGTPTFYFVTTAWQDTANVGSIPRSMTTFTIKDWDAWLKNFNDANQERTDNGIVVRLIGHDADDNKKVNLVTALTDTAKAFAYYKSDALKKRREAGGVTSEPERFLFTIAQRY